MKNVEDLYELSPTQQGMLFHALQAPAMERDYLIQIGCRLRGPLDAGAFARAWRQMVARHAALRTSFHWTGLDKPLQVVHRDAALPLVQEDWRGLPAAERAGRLAALSEREFRGFSLSEAPLLRLALVRLAQDEHRFLWTFHHIILDGWSASLLLSEVFACYRALREGRQAELAATRPYRDYILWLQQQDVRATEAYWRTALSGFQAPTLFGVDRAPLSDAPPARYAEERAALSREAAEALRRLAKLQRLTPNTLVQGAWALLLSRYSGDDDVLFGTVVAGRPASLAGSPSMVGLFVNTLAARVRVDQHEPVLSWLARLQAQQVAMREYEHSALLDVQGWSEVPRGRPLFESLLIFENWTGDLSFRDWAGELEIGEVHCLEGGTGYALTVGAAPGPDFPLNVMYDATRFDTASVVRLLGHLRTLLEGIARDPARRVLELPMLTSEEETALSRWNATATDAPPGETLPERLQRQASLTPDAVAVEFGERRLSYRELSERASALAQQLRALGVGPGVLAGVFMERSLEMLVALLGVLEAGGAYVPIDPAYPGERVAFMLSDSGLSIVLTQAALAATLPATAARVLCMDEPGDPVGEREDAPRPELRHDDLAYVIYTSGSTGRPKGVQVTHGSLANFLASMQRAPGFAAADVLLSVTTLSFDIAGLELFLPLVAGGRLVLVSREEAADGVRLLSRLRSSGATVMQATPATWRLLLEAGWRDSGLKILCGGESLTRELADRLLERGSSVWNLYGPTETTIWSTLWRVEAGEQPVSIGRPIANTQVHLLDRQGRRVPARVPGELCIGGRGLARGYLGRADLTAERFVPDPFGAEPGARLYRTGDLARYTPDGRIEWLARLDQQVKLRGFRIEPGEIEAALLRHPELKQAAVVVREDTPGDQRLVGYVVAEAPEAANDTQPDRPGLAARLRRQLRETLPDHMVPASILVLDAFPLTPNGKVDRRALPRPEGAEGRQEGYVAPRTPTERSLAAIWQECLDASAVGIYDNFFELGGHSLLAMRVVSRIQEALEAEIPLRCLFQRPTLAALAEAVDDARRGVPAPARVPIAPVARDRPLALSFAQERLWFLEQLEPGNPLHTIPAAVRLRGRLDVSALERSLQEIERRHEALRTTFALVDGGPAQVVAPAGALRLEHEDLGGLPEPARADACRRLLQEEGGRFLDAGRGPLFRCRLLRLAADEHLLLLSVHHLVFDGWSLGVFLGELASLYAAFQEGQPSPLAEPRIQYADVAAWQRGWLQGEVLERQLAYWKRKLAAPPVLDLPTDRPRPSTQSFSGAQRSFTLPLALSETLRELSRRQGATLFMTLLAAFQALLCRYTGQDDVVVGSPIAGRLRPELESVIGLFANTLPLRGDLSGDPRFRELLDRTRETALEAFAAQDIPFEKLVEELRPVRDLSRSPLFQVMFVLQNAPLAAVALRDLSLSAEPVARSVAQFDLALYMDEGPEGLAGALEYNTDLFDTGSIDRMIRHFQTLLEGIGANPDARVSELPLLGAAELRKLEAWNGTERGYRRGALLPELIEAQVDLRPDAVAVEFAGERLTYRDLNGRANVLAGALRDMGVGPGDLVGIHMERSLEMLVGVLGVMKAGGAYVPLDPSYPAERLSYMLEDSEAPVLLTQSALAGSLASRRARVFCLDAGYGIGGAGNHARLGSAEDLAYVIYTSGSTGRPKGVQVTHRSLVNFLESMRAEPGMADADVMLSVTTLSFDIAGLELYLPLLVGGRVVLASREEAMDGERLLGLLEGSGATAMQATPATWRLLLEAGWRGDGRLKVLCGGEALPRDLAERLLERGASVWNLYGPTETTIWSTLWKVEPGGGPVTLGRPIGNTQVYLLDGRGQRVPVGVPGELCIGGEGLARGYWKRADLTAERFVPDPFGESGSRLYRTGDLARFLGDGRLEWLSRLDHQVKLRGYRIELEEIESVLARHQAVRQAVAMVREDVAGDSRLVAYVVAAAEATQAEDGPARPELAGRLRGYLLETLPEYMVPGAWLFLDAFPLTPNGKVDRKALPRPEPRGGAGGYVAPEAATDRAIADVWQEVLRVERVGLHDNFFDLGGHSLLLMQVQGKLRRLLSREVPIVDLFRHPTVAALGRHLRNGADAGPEPAAEAEAIASVQAGRQRLEQRRRQHSGEGR